MFVIRPIHVFEACLRNVHECAKSVNFQNIQAYVKKCQSCNLKINHSKLLIAKEVQSTLCDMGYKYTIKRKGCISVISIVIMISDGQPTNCSLISSQGPHSLLFTGYWGLFPWGAWQLGCDVAHPLPCGAEVKNGWSNFQSPL
jgi:hypothetical protein